MSFSLFRVGTENSALLYIGHVHSTHKNRVGVKPEDIT